MDKEEAITSVSGSSLVIFLIFTLWDFILTYIGFQNLSSSVFLQHEFNKELALFFVNGNIPFIYIVFHTSLVFLFFFTRKRYKEKNTGNSLYIFLLVSILLAVVGSIHFFGGFTWIANGVVTR